MKLKKRQHNGLIIIIGTVLSGVVEWSMNQLPICGIGCLFVAVIALDRNFESTTTRQLGLLGTLCYTFNMIFHNKTQTKPEKPSIYKIIKKKNEYSRQTINQ